MKTSAFLGTGTLVLLALKRDRIRLALWIPGIAILLGFMIAAFGAMLPTDQDIIYMATAHGSNPVMRVFLGPISGVSLGGFMMFRISTMFAIMIAFFGILTVTRHTRDNEESGCEELTGSTVVGRHAGLLAALIVTTAGSILLAVLFALAFIANGHPVGGSFAAGAALGAVGISFAGVAAITAQLANTTRGANGMAGLAMGAAFLVSGIGNMLGDFNAATIKITSAWPVWLSPFGWYQQIHAFYENNWWVMILFAAFLVLTAKAAFLLNSRRDVGMGMIPTHKGPAAAAPGLLSPLGLAWRLQRKLFMAWSMAALVFGAVLGGATTELSERMRGMERAELLGDIFSMSETFAMALVAILGPFIVFYTVQAFLRAVSEETDGLTEPILATAITRLQWIMSHITCFVLGTIAVLLALGFGSAVSAIAEPDIRVLKLLEAAMLQAPAILVLAGLAILVFGLAPRWSPTLLWTALIISLLVGPFLGPALDLPQWVQNISPFTHVPPVTEPVSAAPIIVMLLIAAALTAIGLLSYCRRSMRT
jgi:ABC-2 type transport system permease protein